eukprot:6721082-Alexandrium_andersonii.AAC.1
MAGARAARHRASLVALLSFAVVTRAFTVQGSAGEARVASDEKYDKRSMGCSSLAGRSRVLGRQRARLGLSLIHI